MGRRHSGSRSSGPRGGKKRAFRPRRRKVCYFCANPEILIDYKNIDLMRRFISDRGKIQPRRRSGTCPRHQRDIARHIKKAREIAIIPYTID
ncbi:MAG TPA: 30S ribosomal protein S18 [bacterium]|jgi:small subunit ribosomal protein S18